MTLAELRDRVGTEVGVSDWLTVSQETIRQFADATGDHQWIHLDVERAKAESPFGTTIAHGFLTMSLLVQLMADAVPMEEPCKLSVNYGFNRLRFVSPVPAGSRIRVRAVLTSLKDLDAAVEFTWGITVEIEGREKPAVVAEWLSRRYL
ncbi:nodulation protein NodN [Bryobacterales bacterium F-183]|nr:nodulation protein NodN [Bryobacterales bacterium F-183]